MTLGLCHILRIDQGLLGPGENAMMEATMQRLIDDPESALRRAADHVLTGYAWFYSDRSVTVPAAAMLVTLADEILAERRRWLAILARN
jgi:hypothetical protein